jgi:predicted nucleic acid-binding Zn ribbon protein
MAEKGISALGDVLTELMARRGFARVRAAAAWESAWRSAAGPQLSKQSTIGGSRGGTLEVIVANSMLAQEIAFQKPNLIAELRRLLPDERIKDLRVRVGRIE